MMSDVEMAQYATYGGFLVMLLLILYHYDIVAASESLSKSDVQE